MRSARRKPKRCSRGVPGHDLFSIPIGLDERCQPRREPAALIGWRHAAGAMGKQRIARRNWKAPGEEAGVRDAAQLREQARREGKSAVHQDVGMKLVEHAAQRIDLRDQPLE
jgi:hypothetical protein